MAIKVLLSFTGGLRELSLQKLYGLEVIKRWRDGAGVILGVTQAGQREFLTSIHSIVLGGQN